MIRVSTHSTSARFNLLPAEGSPNGAQAPARLRLKWWRALYRSGPTNAKKKRVPEETETLWKTVSQVR